MARLPFTEYFEFPLLLFWHVRRPVQGGFEKATVLYEWSLSEAISTCIRSASPRASISEDITEDAGAEKASRSPPFPAVTGIAAWDSALLQDYHSRLQADKKRIADKAAADTFSEGVAGEVTQLSTGGGVGATVAAAAAAAVAAATPSDVAPAPYDDDDDRPFFEETNTTSTTVGSEASPQDCESGHEGNQQPRSVSNVVHGLAHNVLQDEEECSRPARSDNQQEHSAGDERQREDRLEDEESPLPLVRPAAANNPSRCRGEKRRRLPRGLHGALELVTRCLRTDGFNAKAYSLRAELEARLGRRDRAIADYKAAASLEVGDPRSRINMVGSDPTGNFLAPSYGSPLLSKNVGSVFGYWFNEQLEGGKSVECFS